MGEGKPRWVSLSKYLICKHCFLCCIGPNTCSCECITEWGPTQQFNNDSELQLWLDYFKHLNNAIKVNTNSEYDVCKADYAYMYKTIINRVCKICESNLSPKNGCLGRVCLINWDHLREDSGVTPSDWICEGCFNSAIYPSDSGHKTLKFASAREGALDYTPVWRRV